MLLHIICLVPTFGAFAWLIGACACEALAITATDAFTGGIVPSYLSDVSAERPGFLPMAFGGGLAAGCFLLQHAWLSRRYATAVEIMFLYEPVPFRRGAILWRTACALSCTASVALLVSVCIGRFQQEVVHLAFLWAFLGLQTVATTIFTAVSFSIHRTRPDAAASFGPKAALCALVWVCLAVYQPGANSWSGVDCIPARLQLDSQYCREHATYCDDHLLAGTAAAARWSWGREDDGCRAAPCTYLFDYGLTTDSPECPSIHAARAAAQLLCFVGLVLFQASFVVENWAAARLATEEAEAEFQKLTSATKGAKEGNLPQPVPFPAPLRPPSSTTGDGMKPGAHKGASRTADTRKKIVQSI